MKIVDVLKQSVSCAKRMSVWALALSGLFAPSVGAVTITGVAAQQRLSSNGLVDITVTFGGTASDVAKANCTFTATDSATKTSLPVVHITRNGNDSGSGNVWTRSFVWDTLADVGGKRIDDVELVVELDGLGGVQLWASGPYWAECNVGALKPEECGFYFWWGDTVGCKRNTSNDRWISTNGGEIFDFDRYYVHYKGDLKLFGYIDSFNNLVAAFDAATAHRGAPWRMPTKVELSALIDNCKTTWTTRNGVRGMLVTGKGAYATNNIFLPAAGYGEGSQLVNIGESGLYWSSTSDSYSSGIDAWYSAFSESHFDLQSTRLYTTDPRNGLSVRPVREFVATSTGSTHLSLNCGDHKIHFDVNDEWFRDGNAGSILNANIYPATGTMDDLPYVDGRDAVLLQNKYAREGFEFSGWAKAKNFDAVYQDGATIKANELPASDSGLVLYAVWKAKTVVITLDYREWSGASQNIKTKTATTGYGVQMPWFPIVSSSSDVIDGWYTAPSGGTRVDTGVWWVPTKDTTYYLHWRHKTCTIKYNANGGTGSMPNQSFTMGINQRLSLNQFQHDGYVFGGWAKSSDGAVVYTDGEGVLLPTAIDGGTVTLYAVWKAASTSANDNFASAAAISGSSGSTAGSNVGSTVESGEPLLTSFSTATGSTVWWKWTAPSSGSVRIDTVGSSFDTQMGIFTGTALSSLTLKTKNDDGGANNTSVCTFNCTGGITYYICVGGYQGRTGTIKLYWNLTPSGEDSDFEIVNGVVTKYKGSGGAVAIPADVTGIGYRAFYDCKGLTSVTMPSSVTYIGQQAFYGCSGLTSVTIPSSVTYIDNYAFYGCGVLASIAIPYGVTHIGDYAFYECSSLTSVTVPSKVTSIGYGVFAYCSGLTSVTIPSGVTCINNGAFEYCSSLTSVTIPSSVTSIGEYAFAYCSGLTSVTIREGVTSIGNCAFFNCSGLTSVTIPSSVKSVGRYALYLCSGLTAIYVDGGNNDYCSIDGVLYNKQKTKLIRCPGGKTGEMTIPSGATSIEESAFSRCSELTSVTIPSSVTDIGSEAFSSCRSLTSVTLQSGVTSIGDCAFEYCSSLVSVTIPASVTAIGNDAYKYCSKLKTVYVSKGDAERVRNLMSASGFNVGGVEFVDPATTPANDNFASAAAISGSSGAKTGSNVGATSESGEPLLSYKSSATKTVWWNWTAPSSGRARFDTIGSAFDTVMGVYTGASLSSLTKVAEDDDGAGSGNASKCEFDCTAGKRYYIVVAGCSGKTGAIKLQWSLTASTTVAVAFVANNGTVSFSSRSYTVGSAYGTLPTATRSGFAFDGWYTASSGGTKVTTSTIASASVTRLYAHWTATTYMIEFKSSGGSGTMSSMSCSPDKVYALTRCAFKNTGTAFKGWACSNGKRYDDGMLVFNLAQPGATVTMTAVWEDGVQLWEDGPFWATCNVGATKPEECGYYFWWGDTVGYMRNANDDGWISVKDGTSHQFNDCPISVKNNSQLQSEGYIDSTGNLVAKYDAATAHLGASWRMPTIAEIETLTSNCDTIWTTRNGVYGRLVSGRGAYASKSIFLPAAGMGTGSELDALGSLGHYWSSTPYSGYSHGARDLFVYSSDFSGGCYSYRYCGQSVRPVRGFSK